MGKFLLPGVLNGADKIWAVVAVVVLAGAAWLGWKVLTSPPATTERDTPLRRFWLLLGGSVGLVLLHVGIYLVYMLYTRTTTALNNLDLRLLNPAYFGLVVLALVLIDRLRGLPPESANPWWTRGRFVAILWAAANVALGLVAIVAFAAGNSFFSGNYDDSTFQAVRDNSALAAIPAGCHVYSNLPNALYPAVDSKWSPRRTGLESTDRVHDLGELIPTLDHRPACLVWVDEQPRYGHLWTLDQLKKRLTLDRIAHHGDVSVYRMEQP